MVTSFTRIVVVLSLLRTALGTCDGAAQRSADLACDVFSPRS
jgi:flagellar biosynthesis protein FliP